MTRLHRARVRLAALGLACMAGLPASARVPPVAAAIAAAERLDAEIPGGVEIGWRPATGRASWVEFLLPLPPPRSSNVSADQAVRRRLDRDAELYGLGPRSRLRLIEDRADAHGLRRLLYQQLLDRVPVFGGRLSAHLDRAGRLRRIHSHLVAGSAAIELEPAIGEEAARAIAVGSLAVRARLSVESSELVVFVPGLDRGAPGAARLAWMVVAGDGGQVRERAFVDAHTGKWIDSLTLVADGLERRTFSGRDQAPFDGIPDTWPDSPDWIEGDSFPTGTRERDAVLEATADLHALFAALGRDSYDGGGHVLDISWNRASFCPNASWNGRLASFCAGFAAHDVVGHEWTHAYTDISAGLIYRWQSGAIDESLSDLWGELVDQAATLKTAADTDQPAQRRADGECSTFSPARLRIVSPPPLAGELAGGLAAFGAPPASMPTTQIVAVLDAGGEDPHDACEPLVEASNLAGGIAFVHRGDCDYEAQARRVQQAGAIGLVVANRSSDPAPDTPPQMGCDPVDACDLSIAIPAISLGAADAARLEPSLATAAVRGSIAGSAEHGAAGSVRWLLGEDVRPLGPARDMWSPGCFGDAHTVTDPAYHCAPADRGGVHANSGVPNRLFALLVDGGSIAGAQIAPVGRAALTRLVWRVQNEYLMPYSDFADLAAALGAACADLSGLRLEDPWGGPAIRIDDADCARVEAAIAAVELRAEPPCEFRPILAKDPPALCATGHEYRSQRYGFEGSGEGWLPSRRDLADPASFDDRDWTRVQALPGGRSGSAFFALDPHAGGCVSGEAGDDESGVLVLESPWLAAPSSGATRLAFDHYLATEPEWDGGNLKLRLDDGDWTVVPAAAFLFNPYNGELIPFEEFNSNPLAGEPAFHGADEGSNAGSWGRSIVDLSTLVPPGMRFRLRFELGSDLCVGSDLGWFVDDVVVATCTAEPALFLDGFDSGGAERWSSIAP